MKFFTQGGGLSKADIGSLVDAACAADEAAAGSPPPGPASAPPVVSFLPVYAGQLVELIRTGVAHPSTPSTPLAGMKVVVDAGNGSGGFFADLVLRPLGADTAGSQFLDPDGHFPNHVPNPEDAGAVASAAAAVRSAGADLGVVFDTDVDRSALIDASGAAINRNRLIALLAAVVLRDRPGATIVTDSVTSDGLADFIAAAGGKHLRYKRGYKARCVGCERLAARARDRAIPCARRSPAPSQNVIDKGVELAKAGVDAPLMIETSGHGAMAENHYLDDGAYLAVKCLIEAGRRRLAGQGGLEGILRTLREPLEEAEFRLPLADAAGYKAAGDRVIRAFGAAVAGGALGPGWSAAPGESFEGVRAVVAEPGGRKGWALLRASLHDPLLVANVESETPGGCARAAQALRCWLAALPECDVDTAALDARFAAGGDWEGRDAEGCALLPPPGGGGAPAERLGGGTCGDIECEAVW